MKRKRHVATLFLPVFVGTTMGCDLSDKLVHSFTFGLGAFVASQFQTVMVERQCFLNGEEVDCSELSIPIVIED